MLGYGMSVIRETADGNHNAPDWPDISGWSDIVWPAILGVGVAVMGFGPAVWLAFEGASGTAVAAAGGLGALYCPMAWMAAAMSQRLLAITPLTVIPLLTRTNSTYWLGCGLLLGALAAGSLVGAALHEVLPWFLYAGVGTAAALYFVMVEMRVLGLIWFRHREDFGLESR